MAAQSTTGVLRWRWLAEIQMKDRVSQAESDAFLRRFTSFARSLGSHCTPRRESHLLHIRLDFLSVPDGLRLTEWLAEQPELQTYRLGPLEIAK